MDPGTFKLVIEHQKEYSLPLPVFTPDKVKLGQKKILDNFLPKVKPTARKNKRSVKFVSEKEELEAEKTRINFLDKVYDLNTPML